VTTEHGAVVAGSFRQSPLVGLALRGADLGKRASLYSYPLFLRLASGPPALFEGLSAQAAIRSAGNAHRRVPAYRALLERSGWHDDPHLPASERLARLPITDKAGYIKAFPTEERCLDGKIPMTGAAIDESSGSSGTPYNWVRSRRELHELHRAMAQYGRLYFGQDVITINGFSMGAWATGVNVGEALRYIGVVKSTGPDVDKILSTFDFFGSRYTYVITGYPPFLKHLIDQGEGRGIDWKTYHAFGVVGGEGMSEGLRAYLEQRLEAVYSAYGASDLDIGVAAEVPLSIWARKQAAANPELQRALFGNDSRLPMLFQYNPLDYYVETNEAGELIITVNRLSLLSPRIRYNIHDAGGVVSFARLLATMRDFGLDPIHACSMPGRPNFRLPFLYLFGRSDSTMSYMGANIYPEDVEQALFANADDARRLGAYCLELVDVGRGEQRPCVHVEVLDGTGDDPALTERLRARVLDRLLTTNLDFRAAVKEDVSAKEILVRLYQEGAGPFAESSSKIKRRYILRSPQAGTGTQV
jgi:phenylacetate-CoA ligase